MSVPLFFQKPCIFNFLFLGTLPAKVITAERKNLTMEAAMRWIEFIRLLTAQKDVDALQHAIDAQLETLRNTHGLERVQAMLHATYGTDFAIILVWENQREPVKTREGLVLANCLQQFGLIDHAVWSILRDVVGPASGNSTVDSIATTQTGDAKKERPS